MEKKFPFLVKAGGMRITQHHRPNNSHADAVDTKGLNLIDGCMRGPKYPVIKGEIHNGYLTDNIKNMHNKEKPVINPPIKQSMNIQQPRKD